MADKLRERLEEIKKYAEKSLIHLESLHLESLRPARQNRSVLALVEVAEAAARLVEHAHHDEPEEWASAVYSIECALAKLTEEVKP